MTTDPTDQPHRARQVRPRDWFVLGLVAGLAISLGVYLIARTGAAGSEEAAPSAPSVVTTTVTEPVPADPDAAQSADGSAATPPPADAGGGPSDDGVAATPTPADDVAGSVVQPDGVDDGDHAQDASEAIGPMGDQARRVEGDPLARGDVDAPVVMVVFSDYRCPFCAKFSRDLEPLLIDKYVDDGVLRIEWRDFPLFGEGSVQAAIAGRAAARQGKFWEFNETIYAAAPQSGHPDYSRSDLVDFAREAGVPDLDRFESDMDDPALFGAVNADFDEGSSLGVPATPSFIINGYPIRGAQPIAEFYRVIDTAESLQ